MNKEQRQGHQGKRLTMTTKTIKTILCVCKVKRVCYYSLSICVSPVQVHTLFQLRASEGHSGWLDGSVVLSLSLYPCVSLCTFHFSSLDSLVYSSSRLENLAGSEAVTDSFGAEATKSLAM